MMRRPLLLLALALPVAGCEGRQVMMGGAGEHSEQFAGLFGLFLGVTLFMYLLVIGFLVFAMLRRQGKRQDGSGGRGESREGGLQKLLAGWTALVVLGLTGLTIASYFADQGQALARPAKALKIEVIANQWWWDVRYQDPNPSENLRTANELHLPLGVPVHVVLKSNDVIHSFWIPNLAGKQDLIPGRVNDILLLPRKAGLFRGQCAEYCGIQHAHMALDVTVESETDFKSWYARSLQPAAPPSNPIALAGYNYIMERECSTCHTIGGTTASGQVAPDLTHVASRRSIGAGTYPMSRGHLYAWIADPQSAKPGNKMPYIGLEPDELHGVVAYLESLK